MIISSIVTTGVFSLVLSTPFQATLAATPSFDTLTELTSNLPAEREEGYPKGNYNPRKLCSRSDSSGTWACSNWAGTIKWSPNHVVIPQDEEELSMYLRQNSERDNPSSLKVGVSSNDKIH